MSLPLILKSHTLWTYIGALIFNVPNVILTSSYQCPNVLLNVPNDVPMHRDINSMSPDIN